MKRNRDGLLPRMEVYVWKDGKTKTFRYHPKGKKPIDLGQDQHAAVRRVLDMLGERDIHGSVKWVWEQFTDEKRPAKRWAKLSEGTRADYRTAWKAIEEHAKFALDPMSLVTSPMIANYVHVERADSPRRADIEKSLLSNLFKHGILLGVCEHNPTLVVEPHGSEPSDVMPAETVLVPFLKWLEQKSTDQRRIIALAAEFASLAGSRQIEFLDLSWPQVDMRDGEPVVGGSIRLKRAKQRGKKRGEVIEVVEITPRMADLLRRIKAEARDCLYLFPTRDNNAYTSRGFKTLWQRSVAAAIEAKVLTADNRFNFHALRRYYTTTHKAQTGKLPNLHADVRTTSRVYDATIEERRKAL